MLRPTMLFVLGLTIICGSGCAQQSGENATASAIDKTKYTLTDEPDGAVGVMIAREDAKDKEDIVLVGRIGGRKNPWIEGRSAFMLIDAAMTVVGDGEDSSEGQVCMDDCCASLRADCTTLVKIVDDESNPLAVDTRKLLDVEVGDMVVVKGRVERDDTEGTFVVAASGVYVRR